MGVGELSFYELLYQWNERLKETIVIYIRQNEKKKKKEKTTTTTTLPNFLFCHYTFLWIEMGGIILEGEEGDVIV